VCFPHRGAGVGVGGAVGPLWSKGLIQSVDFNKHYLFILKGLLSICQFDFCKQRAFKPSGRKTTS